MRVGRQELQCLYLTQSQAVCPGVVFLLETLDGYQLRKGRGREEGRKGGKGVEG